MDYIAPRHIDHHPHGVIYNSTKPVGGIRYYQPKKKKVVVEKKGKNKVEVIVELDDKVDTIEKAYEKVKTKESNYQAQELEKPRIPVYKKISDRIKEQRHKEKKKHLSHSDYIIEVQGKEVNFGKEGINRTFISYRDKQWLAKAQHYFITAKEGNKRIGSAVELTTMDMLEALWATAEHEGVDPKRFIVQIYNESRFNPKARGRSGERGIGQFKKSTAKYHGYDWRKITGGVETFAYQAKVSANFVKKVGEVAYNGKGSRALRYQSKISRRLAMISKG